MTHAIGEYKMDIVEKKKKNEISLYVDADLKTNEFNIIKTSTQLTSYSLFVQLILHNTPDILLHTITGQIMPRMWRQGNVRCIISQPNHNHIIALFYENTLDAKENYLHALELNNTITNLFSNHTV